MIGIFNDKSILSVHHNVLVTNTSSFKDYFNQINDYPKERDIIPFFEIKI
jgi:hypothetical protein